MDGRDEPGHDAEMLSRQLQCSVVIAHVQIFRGAQGRPALDLLTQLQHVVEALGTELGIRIEAEAWLVGGTESTLMSIER